MSAFARRQQQTPVSNGFGIGAQAAVKSLTDLAKPRSSAAVTALAAGFSSAKATRCGCGGEYLVVGQVASYDPVLSILDLRQCPKWPNNHPSSWTSTLLQKSTFSLKIQF